MIRISMKSSTFIIYHFFALYYFIVNVFKDSLRDFTDLLYCRISSPVALTMSQTTL